MKVSGITALLLITLALLSGSIAYAGTLSCTVRASSCSGGEVDVFGMSATTNAHSQLPSQSTYTQRVCCSGVTGLGTSCSGTFATVLKFASTSNSHVEQNSQSNYAHSACLSVPSGGSVSVAYQATNCTGYDTTLASMQATTNSHTGDTSAYTTKICATATGAAAQSLSFSISDTTIGFGNLSSAVATYATGDANGTTTAAVAHTLIASTNATNGFTITISGTTLTYASSTISAIGSTNTAPASGTEQFGLRLAVSGGSSTVSSPYDGSGYALDTANFPDIVGSATSSSATSTYSAYYVANIGPTTEAGDYTGNLIYTITANF